MTVDAAIHAHRDQPIPPLTQEETARVMTLRGYPMGRGNVSNLERRALKKLAKLLPESLAITRPGR